MAGVVVLILHPEPGRGAGPLGRWVGEARRELADVHRAGFVAAGALDVRVVGGPPDDTPFGVRLRSFVESERPSGLVVLGSGSIPLATPSDRAAFLAAASSGQPDVLTNNRFSADIVAVGRADILLHLPDLASDNALPRWLADIAGCRVSERRFRRLEIDIDGALDLVLVGDRVLNDVAPPTGVDLVAVQAALDAVRGVAADSRAELVIAGRTSASTLRWLERGVAARVRALVEERGLRSATPAGAAVATAGATPANRRPPRSLLGMLLDRDGPGALGSLLAEVGDAAVIDTRVLLAHRLGGDERLWPAPEDRFASDLLLADRVADPWLRDLTRAAATAAIPILLGGHTLAGPGLRFAVRAGRRSPRPRARARA
jgi:hypothetical protein